MKLSDNFPDSISLVSEGDTLACVESFMGLSIEVPKGYLIE